MWTREVVKARGKAVFYTNRGNTILAIFIVSLLGGCSSAIDAVFGYGTGLGIPVFPAMLSLVLLIFVTLPVEVGKCRFVLNNDEGTADLSDIFSPYRENLSNVIIVMFQMTLFIFLWSLLLVVPGIVKSYQYKFVPYLLAENPDLSWDEAKELSTKMTDGDKWNLFVLDLSWIGWFLLGACTLGILNIFFVTPYMEQTNSEVYRTLAQKIGGGEDFTEWNRQRQNNFVNNDNVQYGSFVNSNNNQEGESDNINMKKSGDIAGGGEYNTGNTFENDGAVTAPAPEDKPSEEETPEDMTSGNGIREEENSGDEPSVE